VGLSRKLRWAVRVPNCFAPCRDRVCGRRAALFSSMTGRFGVASTRNITVLAFSNDLLIVQQRDDGCFGSAAMIDCHYSKLTATMAADRLT